MVTFNYIVNQPGRGNEGTRPAARGQRSDTAIHVPSMSSPVQEKTESVPGAHAQYGTKHRALVNQVLHE